MYKFQIRKKKIKFQQSNSNLKGAEAKEANAVGVRSRKLGDLGAMSIDEFTKKITTEIINKER